MFCWSRTFRGFFILVPLCRRPKAMKLEERSRDIVISINARGEVFSQDTKLDLEALKHKLTAMMRSRPEAFVIINGDVLEYTLKEER
jgi:biopolymer transport protein ExbD